MNYFSNDLEIIITILVINLIFVTVYHLLFNKGKFYLNILRMKINIQNKDSWSKKDNEINDDTKGIDLDFKLQLYNHRKYYASIYNIVVKHRKSNIENPHLNLIDTGKSISGTTSYEKLRYATLLPFEIREFNVKIKLTKQEFQNLEKEPIYIFYKIGIRKKKIKINKYLKLINKNRQNKSIE